MVHSVQVDNSETSEVSNALPYARSIRLLHSAFPIPNSNTSVLWFQNAFSPDWILSSVFSWHLFFSVAMSCSRFLTK